MAEDVWLFCGVACQPGCPLPMLVWLMAELPDDVWAVGLPVEVPEVWAVGLPVEVPEVWAVWVLVPVRVAVVPF